MKLSPLFRRDDNKEIALIAEVVRQAIAGLKVEGSVVVVNNLHIQVNCAEGGGATVNLRNG